MTALHPLRLIAALALILAIGAGAAAAAGGGALSAFEYQQLSSARDRLRTAKSQSMAIFDCQQIQMQTQLLANERADCVSQLRLGGFSSMMRSHEKSCIAYRTAVARLRCLLPPYLQLYRFDASFDVAETTIHRIAVARGLGERCANLLSDPPVVISQEQTARHAIARIIASIRAGNVLEFEAESGRAMTALAAVAEGQQKNRGQLSICPHR